MKTILIFLVLTASAFGLVEKRNGVSILTTSTINGIATTKSDANAIQILDPDASTYFANIVSAGSTIGTTARNAANSFVIGCKQDAIWTLLQDVCLLAGDDLTAALVKVKDFGVGASLTNNNFVSGDYSQSTGLTGNGTTKYLNTGITCNSFTSGSTGVAFYDRTTANLSRNMSGAQVNADATKGYYVQVGPTNAVDSQQYGTDVVSSSALSGAIGFIFATRNSSPLHSIYRNGISLASSSTVSGTLPTFHFYWYAWNLSGTAGLFSTHTMSFLALTSGMDSTQAANFNTRVQAFQTALGRNV